MNEKMPQILQANFKDDALVEEFKRKYRTKSLTGRAINIPTSCLLSGKKATNPDSLINLEENDVVYIYWDEGNLLRKEIYSVVKGFWKNREPWEDYDFCIFPKSLNWCLGFTHNDNCVLQHIENKEK